MERDYWADAKLNWLLGLCPKPVLIGELISKDNLYKLGIRARRAISVSGARTPQEIAKYGSREFIKINGCGVTTLNEIRNWLLEHYRLKMKDDNLSDQEILKRYDWEKINDL